MRILLHLVQKRVEIPKEIPWPLSGKYKKNKKKDLNYLDIPWPIKNLKKEHKIKTNKDK